MPSPRLVASTGLSLKQIKIVANGVVRYMRDHKTDIIEAVQADHLARGWPVLSRETIGRGLTWYDFAFDCPDLMTKLVQVVGEVEPVPAPVVAEIIAELKKRSRKVTAQLVRKAHRDGEFS